MANIGITLLSAALFVLLAIGLVRYVLWFVEVRTLRLSMKAKAPEPQDSGLLHLSLFDSQKRESVLRG